MSVDLRAPVDTRVFATDASSRSCAAVVSRLPESLVREIWRQRPRRGVLQRYAGDDDSAGDGSDIATPTDRAPKPESWSAQLSNALGWKPLFQYSVRRHEHIVTKEARPICTLVRRLAAEVRAGCRLAAEFGFRRLVS